ncbi:MAG TPA: cytochrome c oxidase assembly protein [Allosphingosinicella sp.]|nr:cytochrome c oxidase assembly protein [Allosphingosinicella sp.]
MKRPLVLSLVPMLFAAAPALAHDGAHDGGPGWTLDLWVTAPLLLTALLYGAGFFRLWKRSVQGRPSLKRGGALFAAGWWTLAAAVVSPLHAAGERSFTMHMIEHEVIMLVAALLLVAARPGPVLLWAFPVRARQALAGLGRAGWAVSLWRALTNPVAATALQGLAMWVWHVPSLFDRALASEGWHIAQHLSFLVTALLFWWAMAHGRGGRYSYGTSALCLFVTSLIGGALGALMSFSTSPWYRGYAALGMTPIGLTPVEDQQLAGLLMWIPGGLVHAGAALFFLYKWLKASEARHAVPAE